MARDSFTRPPPRRTMASKVVIGCEGSKTEPLYFEGIRQHLRASTLEFVLVHVPGTDPLSIVDAVIGIPVARAVDRSSAVDGRALPSMRRGARPGTEKSRTATDEVPREVTRT